MGSERWGDQWARPGPRRGEGVLEEWGEENRGDPRGGNGNGQLRDAEETRGSRGTGGRPGAVGTAPAGNRSRPDGRRVWGLERGCGGGGLTHRPLPPGSTWTGCWSTSLTTTSTPSSSRTCWSSSARWTPRWVGPARRFPPDRCTAARASKNGDCWTARC